jgi:hypothetical protein
MNLMANLPSTIYVAMGTVIAASLAGIFSFVSLINQKEGKISEFRQEWIDGLRNDLSKFCSSMDNISSHWQVIAIEEEAAAKREGRKPFMKFDWLSKFHQLSKDDQAVFSECYQRIMLRLNPEDHRCLIEELWAARQLISSPKALDSKEVIQSQLERIVEQSQIALKLEWVRVKKGEQPYRLTTVATFTMLVSLFLLLAGVVVWVLSMAQEA